jgi:NitT/TauT family transport system substrate-binding protein
VRRPLIALLALPLALPLALAGCGGGGDSSSAASGSGSASSGSAQPARLTIGTIPNADVAPIYLGDKQGFFSKRGLTLTFVQAQGGAAIVPAIVSGDEQFGTTNMTSILQADATGLDLKLVAPGSGNTGKEGADFGGVIVKGDSPITSASDLAGKTVAINTINNINDTVVRQAVRKDGGNATSVKFLELGFPDMVAAVATGKVDAAMVVEPFLSVAKSQGLRVVSSPYAVTAKNLSIAGWFTSQKYIQSHPDVVSRFQDAIKESADYARAHPDEVRSILTTYTTIKPEVATAMTLPQYQTEIDESAVQTLLDLGKKDGIIKGNVKVSDVLATK